MTNEVLSGRLEDARLVPQCSDPRVASATEQAAHSARLVVVINVGQVVAIRQWRSADGTSAFLVLPEAFEPDFVESGTATPTVYALCREAMLQSVVRTSVVLAQGENVARSISTALSRQSRYAMTRLNQTEGAAVTSKGSLTSQGVRLQDLTARPFQLGVTLADPSIRTHSWTHLIHANQVPAALPATGRARTEFCVLSRTRHGRLYQVCALQLENAHA